MYILPSSNLTYRNILGTLLAFLLLKGIVRTSNCNCYLMFLFEMSLRFKIVSLRLITFMFLVWIWSWLYYWLLSYLIFFSSSHRLRLLECLATPQTSQDMMNMYPWLTRPSILRGRRNLPFKDPRPPKVRIIEKGMHCLCTFYGRGRGGSLSIGEFI